MDEIVKKRCAAKYVLSHVTDPEFDLDLPKGSAVIGVFFGKKQDKVSLVGQQPKTSYFPILIIDCDPDEPEVTHHFCFTPVDAIVGHNPFHIWKPIGAYMRSDGECLALYNVYTKD